MGAEERFLDALDKEEDEGDEASTMLDRLGKRHQKLQGKNKAVINRFLGEGGRVNSVVILPRYYCELLAWSLQRHVEQEGWKVVRTLGYRNPEPIYLDVNTDYDKSENLLMNGHMLLERAELHFMITVDMNPRWRSSVQVEGPAKRRKEIERFINEVKSIAREQNFYRAKKIEFGGRIHFLNIKDKSWDSIILEPGIKREIRANTIDFLNKRKCWIEYGIPQKRGILLAGEPGTGKTVICKALMAEADGVTCITTNAYGLSADEYITELYEMAQDLSPCIVFIEDIDLIGLNREEYHYQSGPALLSLLNVLDGVEEKQEIVTVATTNNLETLDRAISQRPSRFDRVVKLSLPSLEERKELVGLLCQKIPLDELTQSYIARKTEHCTPAQLQEVIHGLVIEYFNESPAAQSPDTRFSKNIVDSVIAKTNGRNGHRLGFRSTNNHDNGNEPDLPGTVRLI